MPTRMLSLDAYAKLLLLIGSEVDGVAKMLCNKVASTQKAENIRHYQTILTAHFPGMHGVEIDLPRYLTARKPWESWGASPATPPGWWQAYNSVKHQRDKSFADASQENTLRALCGLLALLLYFYKDETHLQPYPDLLNYGLPAYMVTSGGKKLPGT